MQQVDKKNYKIIFVMSVLSILFISGCSSKNEYSSSTKYYENNITKDQLLHAVKRVFNLSDKNAFVIDAYRNELNVTKSKASYKIYTMDIRNDHFDFKVDENTTTKGLKATLSLSRTYGIDKDEIYYVEKNSGIYNLLWDRVDYLLGLKKEWRSCHFYSIDDFLCDMVDLEDNDANEDNLIDLNSTNSIAVESKEKITISTSYTPKNNKDSMNTIIQEQKIYIENNNKDQNSTVKSYKIEKLQEKDLNQTKEFKNIKPILSTPKPKKNDE
ncbi:MAG: hypothetical protein WBG69_06600 [Arcobacteraceae bacterium]